ncbi:MAG: hypothetical protein K9L30_15345 [Desulfobacterales bacterium]|nr:hypothetical protein [Desulfobacterales bacterium]
MDLQELKEKFKHKMQADIKDVDLTLRATPWLVKEVVRLEEEVEGWRKKVEHLEKQLKRQPPLSKKGKWGDAIWELRVDDKKNRLFVSLIGDFDYEAAQRASNHLLMVMQNLMEGFDIVNDLSKFKDIKDNRTIFQARKTIYSLTESGVSNVVRITNPNVERILKTIEKRIGNFDYKVYTANSTPEAEQLLDNMKFIKA